MVTKNFKRVLDNTKYFLLDMDGTVYLGDVLIGNMDKTLDAVRASGKKIVYLTNNSSKSNQKYIEKLVRLNLYREGDEVYTSGMATAEYIAKNYGDKKVYLFGTKALKEEFLSKGINLTDGNSADICVLAYHTEMTYRDLCEIALCLRRGVLYISTHPDDNCPSENGFLPDNGSFIQLLKRSTGREPEIIIGKPFIGMGDNLMARTGLKKEQFTMVGDRMHTDILFGNNCGFNTILVYSGETTAENINNYSNSPDFILEDLNEVVKHL